MNAAEIQAYFGKQQRDIARLTAVVQQQAVGLAAFKQYIETFRPPRSVTEEIDAIDGRRLYYNLCGTVDFTTAVAGQRGTPVTMKVSQDGPFIQTHYPFAIWKPSLPAAATRFGQWFTVTTWPLPTQQISTQDFICLSYEVVDGGAQRNFQNQAAPPLFSRPDALMPLPCPTLFTPNSTLQFFPTYEMISFSSNGTATTQGTLVVCMPGYRIVNL